MTGARTVVSALLAGAIAVAVLVFPAAWAADRFGGVDAVKILNPAAPEVVDLQRATFDETLTGAERIEAVASIYGTAAKAEADRFVFVPAERLIRPAEDPALTLLLADAGRHDVQAKTLWFAAQRVVTGALVAALLLAFVRSRTASTSAPA